MQFLNASGQSIEGVFAGLDQKHHLGVVFDRPLPAVDGHDAGDDVDAGGVPLRDEGARDVARGRLVGQVQKTRQIGGLAALETIRT